MIWELAGDYAWHAGKNGGRGEYFMGNTLTTSIFNAFKLAGPYGNLRAESVMPANSAKVSIELGGWKMGDSNFLISPVMTLANKSTRTIPGASVVEFSYPVSAPANMSDQSGYGLTVTAAGHSGPNNIGGFKANFNKARFTIPAWQAMPPGGAFADAELPAPYQRPIGVRDHGRRRALRAGRRIPGAAGRPALAVPRPCRSARHGAGLFAAMAWTARRSRSDAARQGSP